MTQKEGSFGMLEVVYLDHVVKALQCKCNALQIDKNKVYANLQAHRHRRLWCMISCKAKKHAKRIAFLNRELAEYVNAKEKIEQGNMEEAVRILDKLLEEMREN